MNFSFIVLVICLYFVSQTTVDARTAGRRKNFWPAALSGDYQGDLAHPRFELKRQAGTLLSVLVLRLSHRSRP